MSDETRKELTITRIFDAPPELLFKMWTDPLHLAQWWGPKRFTNPVCEIDARPGGKIRIVMQSPKGDQHPMIGTFREVVPNQRLVFTNVPVDAHNNPLFDGLTTATFEPHLTRMTKLTLLTTAAGSGPIVARMLEGMEAGWHQSIDRLVNLVSPPESASHPTYGNGKICYLEIPTLNLKRSVAFYQSVFGWRTRVRGDGHTAFDDAVGEVSGSWITGRKPTTDAGLLIYIMVDNAAQTLDAVRANGGTVVQPIGMDAPEITARFTDPTGNLLGLYQEPAKKP